MRKRLTMKGKIENIDYREAFERFIKHCKIKNLSDKTIKYYKECKGVFDKFLDEDNFIIKEIDRDLIDEYILHLKNDGIKSVSINTRLRGIRAFLYWCMERGYIDSFKISLVKQEEVLKETYTDEELKILLDKPNIKKCSFAEYRNWGYDKLFNRYRRMIIYFDSYCSSRY